MRSIQVCIRVAAVLAAAGLILCGCGERKSKAPTPPVASISGHAFSNEEPDAPDAPTLYEELRKKRMA